ncbi:YqaI family protein [Peribacillus butanolivorans]|uniref:YqaI family protein n=1 Tax=Peribacillus TaxID=2675229 RepID=UPI0019149554|nr:hypothetical protein [Peribacillus sp. TH27]
MPKKNLEHSKTGYSNLVAQTEHGGIDYFGNEILVGDSIIINKNNGEVFLENSLEDYLIEVLGFQFTTAE